jgi:hypothetical protein
VSLSFSEEDLDLPLLFSARRQAGLWVDHRHDPQAVVPEPLAEHRLFLPLDVRCVNITPYHAR